MRLVNVTALPHDPPCARGHNTGEHAESPLRFTWLKSIRRRAFDPKTLRLTPEEGFVLSRLEASPLSVKELVDLTGIDASRMVTIVETLATQGVVDLDRDGAPAPVFPGAPAAHDDEAPACASEFEQREAEAAEAEAAVSEPCDDDDPTENAEHRSASAREYQRIYENVYRSMDRDARVLAAQTASGSNLLALCHDPEPQVIHAVLGNAKAGLDAARLIAQHHHTHMGLDHVSRRIELVSDSIVQRRLLNNAQLPETLLRKIVGAKLLTDVYKVAVNREIPERSRILTRELLQKKFMLASPDERAALLTRTEGRCLVLLVNCALDARTTQMLTSKTSYTVLFIQNLARWSATPPALLTHLLKQPPVRQNIGLKKMVLKHRNVPSEAKRSMS